MLAGDNPTYRLGKADGLADSVAGAGQCLLARVSSIDQFACCQVKSTLRADQHQPAIRVKNNWRFRHLINIIRQLNRQSYGDV